MSVGVRIIETKFNWKCHEAFLKEILGYELL